jgi:hypothetical protein
MFAAQGPISMQAGKICWGQCSITIRVFSVEKELDKDNSSQQVMANVLIDKSRICKLRSDVLQISQKHLVGPTATLEPRGALSEEFTGDKVNPMKRARSSILKCKRPSAGDISWPQFVNNKIG